MMLYSSCAHNFNHWLLKQNEQRYVQFFRENFEAIAVVDWQGVIREVNQSFAVLFSDQKDVTTQEFVEKSIFEFIDAENRSQVAKMFLSQGDSSIHLTDLPKVEINGLRLDGQGIRVQVGLKMLRNFYGFSSGNASFTNKDLFRSSKNKKSTVFMVSFHDLTAHHQAQAAIVEAEREKHANDAKSKFLANMSHEIRTPLNGVLGMLQLLEDTPLNKEQRLFLKNSVDSANYLLLLINDILDFSKIEAGLLPIDEYEFKLQECIESVVDLLHANARTKQLDLYAFVSPRCPPIVLGDAARLRQVLMNLVSNAIKFTPKGKVLVNCDVDTSADDVPSNSLRLRFQVIDTGIGIKPESIERLFQRFYQVDDNSAMRRNYGGTGLGLAISRNLVGLMGGEIGVNSKFGEGSTFWFTLTCKKAIVQPLITSSSSTSSSEATSQPSNPRNTYADLPPQQLQQQLQHQLQKELHYQLHQQQTAAMSYSDMAAISQTNDKQLQLRQSHQQHSPPSTHSQQAQQHSPQMKHPLAASGGSYPDFSPPTSPSSPTIRSTPTFSFVPPPSSRNTIVIDSPGGSGSPLLSVSIVVVSDNPHTRAILSEYFQAWGYNDIAMYKALSEGVQHITDKKDEERRLIVILCNKGTQLDTNTHDNVVSIKQKVPGDFPCFVLFIEKGNIKTTIPKAILPQATLCYPIRQSQLFQIIMDIRDPAKRLFASQSPSLKNSKEKVTSSMPRVLYVDISSTSRLMVKQTLQNDGLMCEAVPNMREAVLSISNLPSSPSVNSSKFPYDIILVDVGVICSGEVNGVQCTEEIRALERKSYQGRVPIIGITADPAFSLQKGLENGMDGVCNFGQQQTLPFSDLLLSIVRQWLQHAARFSVSSSSSSSPSSSSPSSSSSSSSSSHSPSSSSPSPSPSPATTSPLSLAVNTISNISPTPIALPTFGADATNRNSGENNGIEGEREREKEREREREREVIIKPPLTKEQTRILVVEDNAMNQVVVSTFLKKAGYLFEFASDGQQGVDAYVSNPFNYHLILMDCQMPVMDGYEASIRIRENEVSRGIRRIPIVAMTAAALVVDRERCLAVGMSDFVQKPIQRPLFLEILEKWLRSGEG